MYMLHALQPANCTPAHGVPKAVCECVSGSGFSAKHAGLREVTPACANCGDSAASLAALRSLLRRRLHLVELATVDSCWRSLLTSLREPAGVNQVRLVHRCARHFQPSRKSTHTVVLIERVCGSLPSGRLTNLGKLTRHC